MLSRNLSSNAVFYISLAAFVVFSKHIFDNVFRASQLIIDEEFHLQQGLLYCNFTFNTWNPKITTLPGLYLISAAILGPLQLCSVYGLRFTNLLGSFLNLILFRKYLTLQNPKHSWSNLMSSINIAILPPLYFFSHVYYTDVLSITFILLASIAQKKNNHIMASLYGALSVMMRQTNIVWVVFLLGQYALKQFLVHLKKKHSDICISDLAPLQRHLKVQNILRNLFSKSHQFWTNIATYILVLAAFVLFIFMNGSIVVGDKSAHTASLHVPQLFYFLVFCLIFGWPYFVRELSHFFSYIRNRFIFSVLVLTIFAIIVYVNTLEHDYLLADNRHYTFYIWNRFYAKYKLFRYLMVLVYYFGLYGLLSNLNANRKIILTFMFLLCTTTVLVFQKMIEVRYFLIPYVLFRLHLENVKWSNLLLEFCTFCTINLATFYVFFTKDIYWSDYDYVQKLIW
ncbi:putative Dol-P-Glc:Glc(2)Man(9)GlcNAc(2)-PP-Dol alpha-1,2-glucosyltransferase [Photinus pyralis]|uniref:Dol-P-Glc:Glc(2)Man(9)GlcNAc(2)-PP-Dol alpha-1,2-glucosyltransferase n=1 Tax=Photinus pyralis TaxID=7054 RepID=A0A1Y1N927_PHOPY|nr:putative Dol-P-Glc:Glc(2)Man(9)GlcNAc(2)-PP-Dol alpha-1,2-glucosyltransferase [Photinus pyralis]